MLNRFSIENLSEKERVNRKSQIWEQKTSYYYNLRSRSQVKRDFFKQSIKVVLQSIPAPPPF